MSGNGSAVPQEAAGYGGTGSIDKGKGKAVDMSSGHEMMDEDDSESEESGAEQPEEEVDEDNLEEIDLDNITSKRTRGKQIDWAEAEQKAKAAGDDMDDDDDDEDDEDFEDPEAVADDPDRMEE